ncbi:PREDICTED: T-complex [Prunus dulcis]|uniref:PREDICTED: T-complex n=1 Tax=Prunus dulcis TaxID=3755 RepID=A0A5E4EUR0_PRUDU|nr:PREDICTED: T-complex [Prunus dulcis]
MATRVLMVKQWPYEAAAIAFEAIPRTLAQNCGVNVIRTMTALQGKHANGENAWIGIDGNTGVITDVKEKKVGGYLFGLLLLLSFISFTISIFKFVG